MRRALAPIFQATTGMIGFPHPRRFPAPAAALATGLSLPLILALSGCRVEENGQRAGQWDVAQGGGPSVESSALTRTIRNAMAMADSIEDLLRPVPLLRPAEEEALRRYSNAANVRVARELGVRPANEAELRAALEEGRLVRLEDSTEHWVLRRGIQPYVTPDTYALLERLSAAFQDRLREMGLPPFRFEISSVLRTAEAQARLRRTNPNAAAGTSSHEFGTTVDIVYEAYPAPAELPEGIVPGTAASAEEEAALELVARTFMERMAARKSRELQKILGEVMLDAQSRGEVLVTLERQQPVYHITNAQAGG